jgi:hypothetical protein
MTNIIHTVNDNGDITPPMPKSTAKEKATEHYLQYDGRFYLLATVSTDKKTGGGENKPLGWVPTKTVDPSAAATVRAVEFGKLVLEDADMIGLYERGATIQNQATVRAIAGGSTKEPPAGALNKYLTAELVKKFEKNYVGLQEALKAAWQADQPAVAEYDPSRVWLELCD